MPDKDAITMNEQTKTEVSREDFQNALKDLDTFIDVSMEDLMQINRLARKHARLREVEQVMVRDIMTPDVTTVRPGTPLRDAARILLELRISGLPVTEENGKLAGIVTEADFLAELGVPGHHPAHNLWQTLEGMFRHPPGKGKIPATVADIMTRNIITISDDKTLHDAIELMKRNHIKRIVVTDDQQQLRGIITRSNLVQVLLKQIL
jgi:sulfide:quinone oxidoreductase